MRRVVLLSLVMSVPIAAQESVPATDETLLVLPTRAMPPFLVDVISTPQLESPYSSTLSFSLIADRLNLTDPFGRHGNISYTAQAFGGSMHLDTKHWYLDATGQLINKSIHQRNIATTLDYYFAQNELLAVGLELDYWELTFRNLTTTIGDVVDISTQRTARTALAGTVIRLEGPRSTRIWTATTFGQYANHYDGLIETPWVNGDEPLVSDSVFMVKTRLALETAPMFGRIRFSGSTRYFQVFGERSSWTPDSEWSGDARIDVRVLSRGRKSLFVGVLSRFGPTGPGLVTDKSFGLRGTWKVR